MSVQQNEESFADHAHVQDDDPECPQSYSMNSESSPSVCRMKVEQKHDAEVNLSHIESHSLITGISRRLNSRMATVILDGFFMFFAGLEEGCSQRG